MTKNEANTKTIHSAILDLMDSNIRKIMESDEIYLQDAQDERELEERYMSLPLSIQYKRIINDYHACTCSKMARAIELAYLAGAETALHAEGLMSPAVIL